MALLKGQRGKTLISVITAVALLAVGMPLVSAYEAHTINVTVRVEQQPLPPGKVQVIECLSLYVDESNVFNKAIEKINMSLNPEFWIDDNHLACQHGKKVFDFERYAVRRLMHLLAKFTIDVCTGIAVLDLLYDPDGDGVGTVGAAITVEEGWVEDNLDGTYTIHPVEGQEKLPADTKIYVDGVFHVEIHTSGSQPLYFYLPYGDFMILAYFDDMPSSGAALSGEAVACSEWSIDVMVSIDRALAQTAIDEAAGTPGADPGKLDKAYEELDTGDAFRDALNYEKAIKHYGKAWHNACKAVEDAG